MTPIERHNFNWIAYAMALPICFKSQEFYYDYCQQHLFHVAKAIDNPFCYEVFNQFNCRHEKFTEADLAVRLEFSDDVSRKIITIPRLTIIKRIELQQLFLAEFGKKFHYDELLKAVDKQGDCQGFVLDNALVEKGTLNIDSALIYIYWEDYKHQTMLVLVKDFCDLTGFNLASDEVSILIQ